MWMGCSIITTAAKWSNWWKIGDWKIAGHKVMEVATGWHVPASSVALDHSRAFISHQFSNPQGRSPFTST
jgi:hypothetical protein